MICVNSEFLGTRQHLLYQVDDGEYCWTSRIPDKAWVFGAQNSLYSLDVLFDLLGIEKPEIAVQSHVRSFKVLLTDPVVDIPWHQVLPPHEFSQLVLRLVTSLENALKGFLLTNYMETFVAKRTLLTRLSRAMIDRPLLMSYIRDEENATVRNTLRSFLPSHDTLAQPSVYNQAGTVTGRLTIETGPQVLTLPKKYRNIMKSRYAGGAIFQVDFTSLEPRVARLAAGQSAERDVYIQLSRDLFDSALQRDEVKIAVLCALYGVSQRRLSKMLGEEFKARSIINEIKKFFGIPELVKELRNQITVNHKFKNYFGRTIEPDKVEDNILVNHYVQSTAVDASMLGFQYLLDKITGLNIEPLYLIHDALVLDVDPGAEKQLKDILSQGLSVPSLGTFPVELTVINDARE